MTDCAICLDAERFDVTRNFWANGCKRCSARALAVTGAPLLDTYDEALARIFGADQVEQGRAMVAEWTRLMRRVKAC